MDESERNLLEGLAMVKWPDPPAQFYRLYYQEDGTPVCYSMEEWPHQYIEVDRDTFWLGDMNVKVIDGAIRYIKIANAEKLSPNGQGTPCHSLNVAIVVSEDQPNIRWSIRRRETY